MLYQVHVAYFYKLLYHFKLKIHAVEGYVFAYLYNLE